MVEGTDARFQSLLPGPSIELFEDSAQMTMLDERQRYIQVLRDFLSQVEGSGSRR